MKRDIANIDDIRELVDAFYERVKKDPALAGYFTHVNWESHLPVMYKFWENTLFYTGGYEGNPMAKHSALHARHPLQSELFDHWLNHFCGTVDELFAGEKAELAKQRGISIATIMKIKILHVAPESRNS